MSMIIIELIIFNIILSRNIWKKFNTSLQLIKKYYSYFLWKYTKIETNSNDYLPLEKTSNKCNVVILLTHDFNHNYNKYYPRVSLKKYLHMWAKSSIKINAALWQNWCLKSYRHQ